MRCHQGMRTHQLDLCGLVIHLGAGRILRGPVVFHRVRSACRMGVPKESTKIPELETGILESYASKYEVSRSLWYSGRSSSIMVQPRMNKSGQAAAVGLGREEEARAAAPRPGDELFSGCERGAASTTAPAPARLVPHHRPRRLRRI